MSRIGDSEVREFLKKQTLVKYWIEEVLKVRLGEDLLQSLKNGIVLCYLMAEIEPLSIPKIQEATNAPFRLKENVVFFLEACKELGMRREERFQLGELWGDSVHKPNVVRVVLCLVALARIAADRGFTPAMRNIDTLPDSRILVPEGEMLSDLKEMLFHAGRMRSNDGNKGPKISAELMKKKLAYLGGQNADLSQCEAGFIKFQALYRGYDARQKYKKRVRDLAYRERVAREILKTEKDYVENLDVLIKIFYLPLDEMANGKKPVLTKEQLKGIFADIQTIFNFNESLLKRLEERVESWSIHQKLGDIFVEIVTFMKVYTNYVQNFNTSLSILSIVGKKAAVAKFLKECAENPKCKLDLSAYLIMPVQRIPRYHLLLQDLVKHTWTEHCDYEHLNEAMEKVKQIGTLLNEKKREAETMAETFERHAWIKGKEINVTPDRRFIRQDTFIDAKKNLETTVYLFNDIIIYGKPQGTMVSGKSKIKYGGQYSTLDCEISEKPDFKTHKCCFSIGESIFSAKSEEERANFIGAVKQVKEVAAEKLSSHLKDSNQTPPTPTESTSAEDLLRMRKMQKLDSNSTPSTVPRSKPAAAPLLPSSRVSSMLGSTSDNGTKKNESEIQPNSSEKEALMKSKHTILQQLLDLPAYGSKQDTKKVQKKRGLLQEELETILRKLSEMDLTANSPPIVVNTNDFDESSSRPSSSPPPSSPPPSSNASKTPSPTESPLPTRPARPDKPSAPAKKGDPARNSNNSTTVVVPLSTIRDSGGFNSVRGFKPKAYQAVPFTRSNSNPNLLGTSDSSNSHSATSSPANSPPSSPTSSETRTNVSNPTELKATNQAPPTVPSPTTPSSPVDNSPTSPSPAPADTPSSPTSADPKPVVPPRLVPKGPAKVNKLASNSNSDLNKPAANPERPASPASPAPNYSRPTSPALTNSRPTSPAPKSPTVTPRVASPPPVPPKPASSVRASIAPTDPTRPASPAPTIAGKAANTSMSAIVKPTQAPVLAAGKPANSSLNFAKHGSVIIKPAGPAPAAPSRQAGNLSLDDVLQQKNSLDLLKLETYLSEADFTRVFKMSREEFYKQPKWKQDLLKKENKLN